MSWVLPCPGSAMCLSMGLAGGAAVAVVMESLVSRSQVLGMGSRISARGAVSSSLRGSPQGWKFGNRGAVPPLSCCQISRPPGASGPMCCIWHLIPAHRIGWGGTNSLGTNSGMQRVVTGHGISPPAPHTSPPPTATRTEPSWTRNTHSSPLTSLPSTPTPAPLPNTFPWLLSTCCPTCHCSEVHGIGRVPCQPPACCHSWVQAAWVAKRRT